MADDNQNCSSKSKSIHEEVAYQKIEEKSHEFLRKIYPFIRDYQGQLPNLKDIFQPGAIDWLLAESIKSADSGIEAKPLVDFLIRTGYKDEPKVDKDGKPLLHRATALNLETAGDCVDCWDVVIPDLFKIYDRFDVNYTDEAGYTHFHTACKYGFKEVVEKFLELGQDPNCIVTETGDSPLHVAVGYRCFNVIELLVKRGADMNLANNSGYTPLHIICEVDDDDDSMKMIFDIYKEKNLPVQVNAQDKDYQGQLPNLRDIFQPEAIDWILKESFKPSNNSGTESKLLVDFLISTGYKDEPKVDRDGKPLLHRSTPVHYVCEQYRIVNHIHIVIRELFKIYDRFDVNYTDDSGSTHFHVACDTGCLDLVEKFLELGQDPNCLVSETGDSPLHVARNKEVVELLLRNGADPNLANAEGSTLLHVVCNDDKPHDFNDDETTVKMIFDICDEKNLPVQINAQDKLGWTPLQLALKAGYKKLVECLLRNGADPNLANAEGSTPLHISSQDRFDDYDPLEPESIDWILKKSVEEDDHSIVDFVIHTGYKDEPKVDEDGQPILDRITPIHLVYEDEESTIVSKLFQIYDRFDVNYTDEDGLTHFHLACRFGCEDEVLKFLEAGQDPNSIADEDGNTPLHLALENDRKDVTKLLLRNGADPNLANENGLTPLHVICAGFCNLYCIEMAKMLFEVSDERYHPVQIDARDIKGNTPLHLAIDYRSYKNLVEFLLRNGANPNATNEEGSTPLHIACIECSETFDMLEIFFKTNKELDQLVQLDTRDNSGRTPLQYAVARLLPDVVDLLLDHGADLSGFVFPTASHFRKYFHTKGKNFKLKVASGLLAVVERLENRGYELGRSNALMIMQLFDEYDLFLNTNSVFAKCRYNDEQEREVKKP
ncbi:unnamed protein product [Trichogramma brassicae]|uniref:Uncharacterized protein n=1 Tax=Trichogramma brassicae TaxID=86971 RepID=A0A6H5IGZ8_9HYME|nr:unnamed protein product [Trichogramma brassicae]